MFIQANLGCVLRIHSLSFAYMERSSQNASQEVKFVWQGLNSLNTTNQWVLNDPKQDYGNLAGFKINFWGKKYQKSSSVLGFGTFSQQSPGSYRDERRGQFIAVNTSHSTVGFKRMLSHIQALPSQHRALCCCVPGKENGHNPRTQPRGELPTAPNCLQLHKSPKSP